MKLLIDNWLDVGCMGDKAIKGKALCNPNLARILYKIRRADDGNKISSSARFKVVGKVLYID